MDKQQITIMFVSTIFGIVVKSIVDWIIPVIKTTIIVSAITAKVKIIFSKINLTVLFDIFSFAVNAALLAYLSRATGNQSRLEMLLFVGVFLLTIFSALVILWHISKALNK